MKITMMFRVWIVVAVLTTALCGLVYITAQQVLRQSANDPQIGAAQDVAIALSNGAPATEIIPNANIDIAKSLAPFVIIYNDKGQPLASSAVLNNKVPRVPFSSLQYAKTHGQNRLTWQPQPGVRSAIVVSPFATKQSSGFVIVGRSLTEIEKRESQLMMQVLLGWLGALISTFVVTLLLGFTMTKKQ